MMQLSDAELDVLLEGKGTPHERQMFKSTVENTGLNPFSRQICASFRNSRENVNGQEQWVQKMTIQVQIDGFRTLAAKTGLYGGQDGPYFCGPDGVWQDVWLSDQPPVACKVGVINLNFRQPLYAVAKFSEFAQMKKQGNGYVVNAMWSKMPTLMLAKCAEALALRRAFPDQLSGMIVPEEIAQGATDDNHAAPVVQAPVAPANATASKPVAETKVVTQAQAGNTTAGTEPPPEAYTWAERAIASAQSNNTYAEIMDRVETRLAPFPALRDDTLDKLLALQRDANQNAEEMATA